MLGKLGESEKRSLFVTPRQEDPVKAKSDHVNQQFFALAGLGCINRLIEGLR
jgi:hypothetical protein